jgi:multiple sugar transport system permease protein
MSALPIPALVVPLYELYEKLGLLNSRLFSGGLIGVTVLPFTVWIMTNQIDGVPTELDEAAGLDGAGMFTVLRRIILPVVAPGVSFVFIFAFLQGWGSFLIPLILDSVPSHTPAPIALYDFMSTHTAFAFGAIGAFSVLFCLPVIAL